MLLLNPLQTLEWLQKILSWMLRLVCDEVMKVRVSLMKLLLIRSILQQITTYIERNVSRFASDCLTDKAGYGQQIYC